MATVALCMSITKFAARWLVPNTHELLSLILSSGHQLTIRDLLQPHIVEDGCSLDFCARQKSVPSVEFELADLGSVGKHRITEPPKQQSCVK